MQPPSIDAVVTLLLASGRATRDTVPALLYYGRAVSLAMGQGPAFRGALRADGIGVTCEWSEVAGLGRLPYPFDEVLDTFEATDAGTLQAGIRAERPWRSARAEAAAAETAVPIDDREILSAFAIAFEWGEDACEFLGIPVPEGIPPWATWLRTAMNIGRFEGHPWFDDAESRRIRVSLHLCELPDGWDGGTTPCDARAPIEPEPDFVRPGR